MRKKINEKINKPLLLKYRKTVRDKAIKNLDKNLEKFGIEKKEISKKEYLKLLIIEEEQIRESNLNKTLAFASLIFLGTWL